MIKKQLIACFMAASLAAASLTGCSGSSSSNETSAQETVADVSLDDVLKDIKEAYGENYVPDSAVDEQMLSEYYRTFSRSL